MVSAQAVVVQPVECWQAAFEVAEAALLAEAAVEAVVEAEGRQ